jgi:hypothetical protein
MQALISLITLLLLATPIWPAHASSDTFGLCKFVADNARKSLPIRVDKLTEMTNVTCLSLSNKVVLVYIAEVNLTEEYLSAIDLRALKPAMLNTWCSDPNMKRTLEVFDVNYRYYLQDGLFIGNIELKNTECRGRK